jgi:hypothetical protein
MGSVGFTRKNLLLDNPGHGRPGITGFQGVKTPGGWIPKDVPLHPLVLVGVGGREKASHRPE